MRRKEIMTVDLVSQEVHVDGELKYRGVIELWVDGVGVESVNLEPRDTEDAAFQDAMDTFKIADADSIISGKFRETFGGW